MLQYLSVFMILRYEGGLSPAMAMHGRGVWRLDGVTS